MDHCKRQMQSLGMHGHRYMADISAGATTHLIRAWIRNGFQESPQEIAALVCELAKWDPAG